MQKISQNKKIAISAIALFVISLSTMIFFLGGDANVASEGGANVMGSHGGAEKEGGGSSIDISKTGFSTDLSGNILVTSKEFCKLLGQKCEDIVKQPIYKYVDKDDFSEVAAVLGKLSVSEQTIDSIGPIRIGTDSNSMKIVILSAQSVKDHDGKMMGINFSVKDITDKVGGNGKKLENSNSTDDSEDAQKSWLDGIYPKIKDVNDQTDKLLVKLSYHY